MANDDILKQYEVGPVRLRGEDDYDRHLVFDHVVSLENADQRERFEAVARSLRDLLSQRWLLTQQTQDQANPKRVYYLSMEFLIGRSLANNIINLGRRAAASARTSRSDPRQDWAEVLETEPDAGLGNGGLGPAGRLLHRLAGDAADPGDRLRPALRVRHLPPGDRERLAGRAARPLAAAARPLGGRAAGRDRAGAARAARSSCEGGRLRVVPRPADLPARRALRPAGRRLRRQDDQHACGCGARPRRTTSTSASSAPATSSARWSTAWRPRRSRACSIPTIRPSRARRCASCRSTSWSAARWPTSSRASAARNTTGTPCPTRSPSSSTTRTRRWRWRS